MIKKILKILYLINDCFFLENRRYSKILVLSMISKIGYYVVSVFNIWIFFMIENSKKYFNDIIESFIENVLIC